MNRYLFEKLCKMSQYELKNHLHKELSKYGKVHNNKGYLYHKGTHPVLLVAHLDTVHKQAPKKIIYKNGALSSPYGIGGDDRCGVYLILELLKKYHCSVLFTEDEEIGGIGAERFAKSNFIHNLGVNYIIELDRRGNKDACFYDCANNDFIDFIESTDYFTENYGTFSDISVIAPICGISAVNLSSGYYNAHTTSEYVVMRDVDNVLKQVCKLLCKNTVQFEYVENPKSYFSKSLYDYYAYNEDVSDDGYDSTYNARSIYFVADKRYNCEQYYYADNQYEAGGRFLAEHTHLTWSDLFIEYMGEDEDFI